MATWRFFACVAVSVAVVLLNHAAAVESSPLTDAPPTDWKQWRERANAAAEIEPALGSEGYGASVRLLDSTPKGNPLNVFGLMKAKSQDSPREADPNEGQVGGLYDSPLGWNPEKDSEELGADLVKIYERINDPTRSSAGGTKAFQDYLRSVGVNPPEISALQRLFSLLDHNGDGSLQDVDFDRAADLGYLNSLGSRTMKAMDIDYSGSISWEEFKLAPFFLIVLEDPKRFQLLRDFMNNVPGTVDKVTEVLRDQIGKYEQSNPSSFSFVEVSSKLHRMTQVRPGEEAGSFEDTLDQGTLEELGLTDLAEQMPQESTERVDEVELQPSENMRFAERKGIFGSLSAMANKVTGGLIGSPKKEERPRSLYGIPSELDEQCIMCQYVFQRMENIMKKKVLDDYTAFSEWPNPAKEQSQDALAQLGGGSNGNRPALRQSLFSSTGLRSPTRVIIEATQSMLRDICGDSAPVVFRPACGNIWTRRMSLAYGIVRKRTAASVCEESEFCGMGSYFRSEYAVHTPYMSTKLNDKRGFCGFKGGKFYEKHPKESTIMCALKNAGNSLLGKIM